MATTKKAYTAAEKKQWREQKRDEARQALADSVDKLRSSEGWKQMLDTMARFPNYSLSNRLLISAQNPEAVQVASYKKWESEFNRKPRKGEKAIKIRIPRTIKQKDTNGNEILNDKGQPLTYTFFILRGVLFDVKQTDGDPVPGIPVVPIVGESHRHLIPDLVSLCEVLGTKPDLKKSLSSNGQVAELAHIAASAWVQRLTDDYTKPELEVIAEAAAYLALSEAGFETSNRSVRYIAEWASADLEELHNHAIAVDNAAQEIGIVLGTRNQKESK